MKNVGILKFVLFALVATSQLTVTQVALSMVANQVADCPVCFDPLNPVLLHDDHAVCATCLGDQITHAHANRNGADIDQQLRCPRQGCNYQITEADVQRIIPASLVHFQEIQQAKAENAKPVDFKAQKQDRANRQWQFQHTKPCPQCRRPIEKDGGCKWVNCVGCKTHFCYECLFICAENHQVHPCAPAVNPWAREKADLAAEQRQQFAPASQLSPSEMNGLVIGAVVFMAAVWGISELYDYFMIKKPKNQKDKRPLVGSTPGRQVRPVRVR